LLNQYQTSKRHAKKSYSFTKVSGDGVHEIPVGPVHAGVIEPGHFRFSVVGERIIKLEERLGYTHKGIHSLLLNKDMVNAAKLVARVCGDSNVAYSFAFALACEERLGFVSDQTTQCIRAILLERERLINHIGSNSRAFKKAFI
jgi:Ni,Fe-hydrogenase III large subunit